MNLHYLSVLILAAFVTIIFPVSGDLQTIQPGGTVFLGEEGLDITASGVTDGSQIGWWAPGTNRGSEPTDIVNVSSPDSFYVSPSTFSGEEGLWYRWPENTPVFQVKKPQVSIRVYDETAGFDATGKWVPRGDVVSFEISSNVYEANARGGPEGQVDIVLTSPQGAKYDSVSGPSGSYSLNEIPLTSSLTSTGPVWSTGGVDVGTWTVLAEISMNQIKNNLPDPGAGVSNPVEILIQNVNPLITSSLTPTPQTTLEPTAEVTTPPPTPEPAQTTIQPTAYETQGVPVEAPVITATQTTGIPVNTLTEGTTTPTTLPVSTPLPTTNEPAPEPTPTQSSPGILPILGAVMLLILIRRT